MSSADPDELTADVVVLGASFAGIEVVLQLRRRSARKLTIVVVDRQREHGYLPLVHERLCGRADVGRTRLRSAAFIDSLPETRFVEGEVAGFDPDRKTARLADGRRVRGRFVVVALGSVLEPPAAIAGAERLATYKDEPSFAATAERLRSALADGGTPHIVVIGGGLSGVELAGDLAHLALERPDGWGVPKVSLVGADPGVLSGMSAGVSRAARSALSDQGVDVRVSTRVVSVTADGVKLQATDEDATSDLACELAIWAGGVRPAPILAELGLPRTDDGWLSVGPTLQCFATATPTHPEIFACGDAVRIIGGEGRWPTMQRAIECIWQAKVVARNVARLAAENAKYPDGVPPLVPHRLRRTFFYGVSVGRMSYVVYRGLRIHVPGVTPWFRRWLMRQYFARYAPLRGPDAG